MLFKEKKPGLFKLSFRSKGRLAVNTVASHFDGGGHKFAAGGAVEGTLEDVIARVMAECEKAVRAELSAAP
ncbi:DHHA1 domain protein [compost metagenome]